MEATWQIQFEITRVGSTKTKLYSVSDIGVTIVLREQ